MTTREPYVGWTRQVTGAGYLHYCYVVQGHEIVGRACQRNHRTAATAQACADREARRRNRPRRWYVVHKPCPVCYADLTFHSHSPTGTVQERVAEVLRHVRDAHPQIKVGSVEGQPVSK